jgi:hypothetical protein
VGEFGKKEDLRAVELRGCGEILKGFVAVSRLIRIKYYEKY